MGKTAILSVKIISDAKQAAAGFDEAGGKVSKLSGLASKAKLALAGAAFVGGKFLIGAAKDASELEQSVGAIDTVFKGNAGQMHKWAAAAAQDVGLTKNEFNELGTLIGTQLKNGGTAMRDMAPKTKELISLGSDLSSMFGGTTKDAVSALSSALKGERDPIEKFGVSLTQAKIDAEAAALGFDKVGGSLSAEASQAATLSLIMKQTQDAHGNFAKESNTLAGQQQRLTAEWGNMKSAIGTALLPVLTKAFTWINTYAVPVVTKFLDVLDGIGGGGNVDLAGKLGLAKLQPLLDTVRNAFETIKPAVESFVTGSLVPLGETISAKVGPILQTIANTVLPALVNGFKTIAPPTLEVAGAVLKLVGVLIERLAPVVQGILPVIVTVFTAIVNFVRPVLATLAAIIRTVVAVIKGDWSGAWEGIKSIVSNAWTAIKALVTGALAIIKVVISTAWNGIKAATSAVWNGIKAALAGVWNGIKSAAGAAVSWVKSRVTSAWNGIKAATSAAWNGIKAATSAAWNGIKALISNAVTAIRSTVATRISAVVSLFRSLPGKIRSGLGNVGGMLRNAGQKIIDGLIGGIRDKIQSVKNVLGSVTNLIPDWKGPLSKDKRLLEPAGAAIMGGLVRSIKGAVPELRRTMRYVTDEVAGTSINAPAILPARPGRRSSSPTVGRSGIAARPITININGTIVDRLGVARDVEAVLRELHLIEGRA